MKKVLFAILFYAVPFLSQTKTSTPEKIDSLFAHPFFDTCLVAADIYNLSTQKQVYAKNTKLLLHPASNTKLFTSITALLQLPDSFCYETRLGLTGLVRDSVLDGDLIVKGGADPDFKTNDLDVFVEALRAKGINKVRGNLIGDVGLMDSTFWGKGWMWDDDPSSDAPYLTPLSINDNCILVQAVHDTLNDTLMIRTVPETSFISLTNNSVFDTIFPNGFIISRAYLNRSNDIVISGNYGKGERASSYVNLFNPALYFLQLFKEKLTAAGIEVTGKNLLSDNSAFSDQVIVFRRPLLEVLINLNKISDNLSAELTLINIARQTGERGLNADSGLQFINKVISLIGYDPANYRIVDGSGVSHYNLVSAELINGLLKYLYFNHQQKYQQLLTTLPIGGVDGTLRRRMRGTNASNNVYAKTGTHSGVSCLSGYVTDKNGELYSFSLMMQNYHSKVEVARAYQDEVCNIIASWGSE